LAIDVLFAGIPVADLDNALDWYERFLDGPPDMAPNETERAWQLTGDGWLYVVQDPGRAGHALVTLLVDDLDTRIRELNGRGIETGEVERLNERTRKLTVSDPDGNRIQLGQAVSSAD
jgi:predicted enzyme related to lactoylglutathione lyase